jgi:hypothetical protein
MTKFVLFSFDKRQIGNIHTLSRLQRYALFSFSVWILFLSTLLPRFSSPCAEVDCSTLPSDSLAHCGKQDGDHERVASEIRHYAIVDACKTAPCVVRIKIQSAATARISGPVLSVGYETTSESFLRKADAFSFRESSSFLKLNSVIRFSTCV